MKDAVRQREFIDFDSLVRFLTLPDESIDITNPSDKPNPYHLVFKNYKDFHCESGSVVIDIKDESGIGLGGGYGAAYPVAGKGSKKSYLARTENGDLAIKLTDDFAILYFVVSLFGGKEEWLRCLKVPENTTTDQTRLTN